jgi:hypothetical protein
MTNPIDRLQVEAKQAEDAAKALLLGASWVSSSFFLVPENNWLLEVPWVYVELADTQREVVLSVHKEEVDDIYGIEVAVCDDPDRTIWWWGVIGTDRPSVTQRVAPDACVAFYKEHFT